MKLNDPHLAPARPDSAFHLDFRPRGRVFPSPADWRDEIVYQVVLDRFERNEDTPSYQPGDNLTLGREGDQGWHFQGGTLRGLARRLDYIQNLGVTSIWVSCPLKQRAVEQTYHGYAIQDFLDVDPRFGTTGDFRALVDAAHDRGMHVILDVVIDHVGDVFMYPEADKPDGGDVMYDGGKRYGFGGWYDGYGKEAKDFSPDDAMWPVEFQDINAFARVGAMDPMNASAAEAKDGDFMSLKKLDLTNPHILRAVINCYKYWIAVVDVDGFRIDALRHVRHPAASDFIHAIREYALSIGKINFLQVGEVADTDEEMRRYIGTNVELRHGGDHDPQSDPDANADYPRLDAVIDFELHRRLIPVLLGERPAIDLHDLYEKRRDFYRDYGRSGRYYLSYLENHDEGGRDRYRLLFGTHEQTPDGYDRPGGDPRLAELASCVLLASMGIPCLYYGTEQGFDGGGEADYFVREAMFGGKWGPFETTGQSFFDEEHPIYARIAKIAEVRKAEPALRYGRQYLRDISGNGVDFGPTALPGAFAFSRVLDVTSIIVVANPSLDWAKGLCVSVDRNLNPPGWQMRNCLDGDWRCEIEENDAGIAFVRLDLPPRGIAILRLSLD